MTLRRSVHTAEKRCCITPALAVTKPGAPAGLFRFAQDFRAGNKFTRALTDRHGLPRPIDVAYELSGAAYITEIDLASWIRGDVDINSKLAEDPGLSSRARKGGVR